MPGNTNYDTLMSTTLEKYRPTLIDNIFKKSFFYNYMMEGGKLKTEDGGRKIVVPLMYGDNSTVKAYEGYDTLDTTPQEGITSAEFEWRQVSGSITISGAEERMNSGESQIVNLLESKTKQCEKSIAKYFAESLFAKGAGKNPNGIPYFVQQDPTASESVGGINQSTNSWWRNIIVDGTKTTNTYDKLKLSLFKLYNRTTDGDEHIDLMIADLTTFEGWENLLTATISVHPGLTNVKMAEMGFDNYKVKGATLGYDTNCTANTVYGINTEYINMTAMSSCNFMTTPFQKPDNQDAKVAQILWMGNLTCSNRQMQGMVHSTAS